MSTPPTSSSDAGTDGDAAAAACGDGVVAGDELCDGPPVGCNTLGAVWASGTASCRTDCSGYDVSTCVLGTQTSEAVTPGARDARYAAALCNDGTPFSFDVFLVAGAKKWVVYLEGGGNCDGTFQSCKGRPRSLVSSALRPADRAAGEPTLNTTFLTRDSTINPDFYDANIAFGRYCSSDGWTGTNATPQTVIVKDGTAPFVFTGRNNAEAFIDTLFRAYGIDDATSEVLFTGNSAGGFGANVNIDLIAKRMPRAIADGRLAMLSGAAWKDVVWNDPAYSDYGKHLTDDQVGEAVSAIYAAETDPKCVALAAASGVSHSRCTGSALTYQAASSAAPAGWGVRTFIAKNRLDQGDMSEHGIPYADATKPADIAARATWLSQMTSAMANVSWLYAPADPQNDANTDNLHGLIVDPLVWEYEPPGYPGKTLKLAVHDFWTTRGPSAGERIVFAGDVPHSGESAQ